MRFLYDLLLVFSTVAVTPVGTVTVLNKFLGSDWLWLTPEREVGQVIIRIDKRDELFSTLNCILKYR